MNRRSLLCGGVAAAAAVAAANAEGFARDAQSPTRGREFYLIRRYQLQSGPAFAATADKYFGGALLPALSRLGLGPVGVFNLTYGEDTPQIVTVIASKDVSALIGLDLILARDAAFLKDGEVFWGPPAATPAFLHVDSRLSVAFEGFPSLVVPSREPHIVQLRTYQSPTYAAHVRKVEMFHQGEFRFFAEAGAKGVFYSDDLIGPRTPSLTYMLAHKDLAALDANWKAFRDHPGWQKLSHDPRYASEPIVSHIDNLILTPTSYSAI
jgi:hypothetical protein